MKRIFIWIGAAMLFLALPLNCQALELIPVGKLVGLQLYDDTVTVAAFDEKTGRAAQDAGLKIGDRILSVNGNPITQASDVAQGLNAKKIANIEIQRGSRRKTLAVPLEQTPEGPRLGIYLRQGIAGVGTVTWLDPETGLFGCLGHGVSDSGGTLLRLTGGNVYGASVERIVKGKAGNPGQLRGRSDPEALWGNLTANTPQGVFGNIVVPYSGTPIPTAEFEEVQTGSASIRSTVQGSSPQEYSVEILKIYPQDRPDGRNFLLKVTDPKLLETTGGIVQGMSGSPLLQNGKIIGAVTHVLVNDPTTGYGIFIENMLEAAG